eukprot:g17130.t1
MRTAQMGVQVDEKVLRSFWPEELQHEVLLKFQQAEAEAETTFLELLPRCAESMIAAITSDKANKVDDVGDDIMPLHVDPNFQVSFRSKPSSSDWIGVDMSKDGICARQAVYTKQFCMLSVCSFCFDSPYYFQETLPQAKEALPPVQDPSPWASDSPRALGITSQSKQAAPEETLLEVPEALTTPEVPEAPHRPIRRRVPQARHKRPVDAYRLTMFTNAFAVTARSMRV